MDFFVIVITRNILYFPIVVVVQQKVLQYIFNRNHFKGKVRKKTRNPVLTHTNSCRTRSIKVWELVREGDWMARNVEKLLYICNTNSLAIRQKERSGVGKAGIHTK